MRSPPERIEVILGALDVPEINAGSAPHKNAARNLMPFQALPPLQPYIRVASQYSVAGAVPVSWTAKPVWANTSRQR